MIYGAKTDIGKIRELNEDSFGCKENLFVVADGMGGHQAGEVASSIAVETLLGMELSNADEKELVKVVLKANEAILAKVAEQPELTGMGTTIAALLLLPERAIVAHVGDSRIYRYTEKGEFSRLTEDHSLVAELVRNGELTEEEAKNHPQRNMLTRALGTKGILDIETGSFEVKKGDKFLICSDGLTSIIDEAMIKAVMSKEDNPQTLAEQLVSLANEHGGHDNITVIVISI